MQDQFNKAFEATTNSRASETLRTGAGFFAKRRRIISWVLIRNSLCHYLEDLIRYRPRPECNRYRSNAPCISRRTCSWERGVRLLVPSQTSSTPFLLLDYAVADVICALPTKPNYLAIDIASIENPTLQPRQLLKFRHKDPAFARRMKEQHR